MAGYHFEIRSTKDTEDLGGMDLPDDAEAVAFGKRIIRDLMDRAGEQYESWTMEIREGERAVRSLPFKQSAGRSRKI
jgi:Domain of unknown function (DUF6894)